MTEQDYDAPASRPRVLWIARMLFSPDVRIRETELARELAGSADVFALDRGDAVPLELQGLAGKIAMRRKLWAASPAPAPLPDSSEGIRRFAMRVAAATGPVFNRLAARRNNRQIHRAVKHFGCSHVFLSSPFFFLPPPRKARAWRVHFDLVDNFYDEWPDTLVGRSRKAFLRDILRNADTLSASSHGQCELIERLAGRKAAFVPNGIPFARFDDVSGDDARKLREKLGLEDRFVVGFICNHRMPFDGMETLVEGLLKARSEKPELALLIVGPDSDKYAGPRGLGPEQGIFAIGPVPPNEVASYFLACDAGVHPHAPSPVTHDALALNVLEFSACAKPVLANPLREFQRIGLPNVRFVKSNTVQAWASALVDDASFAPFEEATLERATRAFDWKIAADALRREMVL